MYTDASFEFAFPPPFSPVAVHGGCGGCGGGHGLLYSHNPLADAALLPVFTSELPDIGSRLGNMVQTSIVSEYDLGGEGDLFKAPELIIEEPVLGLDPMAAAISMISAGDDVISETIKVSGIESIQSDNLLSDVLYECKKDLLEESAIEESINELLDVKVPPLQIEQAPCMEKHRFVTDGPIQKSISSGCLHSKEWIHGCPMRPNFFDFQGVDLEAAFGLRRAYSEGDIQNLGNSSSSVTAGVHSTFEQLLSITDLKTEERRQKLSRYRKKKVKRNFGRKIKYACRKALADSQPRVRGRFAKIEECEVLKTKK